MKSISRLQRAAAIAVGVGVMSALVAAQQPGRVVTPVRDPVIARGEYLVHIMVCNDCHTPLKMGPKGPEPDMTRMLSGHPEGMVMPPAPQLAPDAPWNFTGAATLTAFAGPWGVSYARNLTPDKETGLGDWTEPQFVAAMRTGRHQGIPTGRMILPPMPWPWYSQMTDEDLHAVWTYLRAIPPIRNAAPQSVPAPPPAAPAQH